MRKYFLKWKRSEAKKIVYSRTWSKRRSKLKRIYSKRKKLLSQRSLKQKKIKRWRCLDIFSLLSPSWPWNETYPLWSIVFLNYFLIALHKQLTGFALSPMLIHGNVLTLDIVLYNCCYISLHVVSIVAI